MSPRRPATTETISADEILTITDHGAAERSESMYLRKTVAVTVREQARRALFDSDLARRYLPQVKVRFVYCKETIWSIMWGKWLLEDEIERMKKENATGRDISIRLLEAGNHFVRSSF